MYIVSFFTNLGVPSVGLFPTIKIIEVSTGNVIANNLPMSELSDGFYYYDFNTYDYIKDYAILCDGTAALGDTERYMAAGNENYHEDINTVISNNNLLKRIVGLLHENIFIDMPVYDDDSNLVSARVRIYSDPASAGTNNDVIGTYLISSTGSGPGKFTNWSQIIL